MASLDELLLSIPLLRDGSGGADAGDDSSIDEASMLVGKKRQKRKIKGRNIDPLIEGMVGEANAAYMLQQYEKAVELCEQAIAGAPDFIDPYHTLATICEQTGDLAKALDTNLAAFKVDPKDVALVKKIAVLSKETGNIPQALQFFHKAVRMDSTDIESLMDCASLHWENKEYSKASDLYKKALEIPHIEEAPLLVKLAQIAHTDNRSQDAIELLYRCLNACWGTETEGGFKETEDVDDVTTMKGMLGLHVANMLSELLFKAKQYADACSVLERANRYSQVHGNSAQPAELTIKYGLCKAHLGELSVAERVLGVLWTLPVGDYHDMYLDYAETMMANPGHESLVVRATTALRTLPMYTHDPKLLMMEAKCLDILHDESGAVARCTALLGVVSSAPPEEVETMRNEVNNMLVRLLAALGQHEAAVVQLRSATFLNNVLRGLHSANIMKDAGRPTEAAEWLDSTLTIPDEDKRGKAPRICAEAIRDLGADTFVSLVRYVCDYYSDNGEYCRCGPLLHKARRACKSKGSQPIRGFVNEELALQVVMQRQKAAEQRAALAAAAADAETGTNLASTERAMNKQASALVAQRIQAAARVAAALEAYSIQLAFRNRDYEAINERVFRFVTHEGHKSQAAWNAFSQCCLMLMPPQKLFVRGLDRCQHSIDMILLSAHRCLATRMYFTALGLYFKAAAILPKNPLLSMCIGVAYAVLSVSKRVPAAARDHAVKAVGFLSQYKELRLQSGDVADQHPALLQMEVDYNLGRLFQLLSMFHLATPCYDRVLKVDVRSVPPDMLQRFDLRREAAFNLCQIYFSSNPNSTLGFELMRKYLSYD